MRGQEGSRTADLGATASWHRRNPVVERSRSPECNFLRPYHQVFVVESVASLVIPVVLFMLIIGYGNRKLAQKPGPLTFGRSQAKIHDQSSEITVRFKDVAGVDEAKAELVEVV